MDRPSAASHDDAHRFGLFQGALYTLQMPRCFAAISVLLVVLGLRGLKDPPHDSVPFEVRGARFETALEVDRGPPEEYVVSLDLAPCPENVWITRASPALEEPIGNAGHPEGSAIRHAGRGPRLHADLRADRWPDLDSAQPSSGLAPSSLSWVRSSKSLAAWRSRSCALGSPQARLTILPLWTAGRAPTCSVHRWTWT